MHSPSKEKQNLRTGVLTITIQLSLLYAHSTKRKCGESQEMICKQNPNIHRYGTPLDKRKSLFLRSTTAMEILPERLEKWDYALRR